jgi:RNA polymerase sigma-70 factor, ECF subfamily
MDRTRRAAAGCRVSVEGVTESTVLVTARRGDEQAFVRLTAPHRRALHRHCYRMLGSLDVADVLDDTVPAVNSALQRAREGLERERADGGLVRAHQPASGATQRRVMQRFVEAWEAVDVRGLMALLSDDAFLTMPPEPMRFVGRDAIGGFFSTVPAGGNLTRIRFLPTAANRQPALAAYYAPEPGDRFGAYGVMVFAFAAETVGGITGFAGYPQLMPALGLPKALDD